MPNPKLLYHSEVVAPNKVEQLHYQVWLLQADDGEAEGPVTAAGKTLLTVLG